MRVGPPRINLAMFRETAHASSIKLGVLMTLNLPVWHLQGRKCVWKRVLLIVSQMILIFFNHCEQRNMQFISHITNHCFPSSQLAWTRVKLCNLEVDVLVQDSIIVITLNLSGWHLQVRRCVWNRIFVHCV